jgi:hypothetical protein
MDLAKLARPRRILQPHLAKTAYAMIRTRSTLRPQICAAAPGYSSQMLRMFRETLRFTPLSRALRVERIPLQTQ